MPIMLRIALVGPTIFLATIYVCGWVYEAVPRTQHSPEVYAFLAIVLLGSFLGFAVEIIALPIAVLKLWRNSHLRTLGNMAFILAGLPPVWFFISKIVIP